VLDLKVRHDLARAVYDDHLMMIVCPVETRVVSDLVPIFMNTSRMPRPRLVAVTSEA
jgi:hypothetical protein